MQATKRLSHLFHLFFIILLFSCSKTVTTEGKWIKGSEKDQIKTIENQFRGMDKTMIEIGYRYQELYWGGQDENWDYAKYQINKIEKSLKLGLQRRPKRANSAQNFISYAIPEMKKAIETKEKTKFNKAFNTLRINCMSCHASENFPTFNLEIPKEKQSPIEKNVF